MKTNIIESIDKLMRVVEEYHIRDVHAQLEYLGKLKEDLSNDLELSERKKLSIYQTLFPPRGGLSDINYWDNNFEKRKEVNSILLQTKTAIANFLLDK